MRVSMHPTFSGEDNGEGGVRRVVENMKLSLSKYRISFIDDPADADLIACHIAAPDAWLRRHPDKPLIALCHGLYWSEYEWPAWAYKANSEVLKLCAAADLIIAPTEWVAQIIRRHTSRDVRVIPHGVSQREWKPSATNKGYVLWNKTRPDPVCDPEPVMALARLMPEQPFVTTFGTEAPNIVITGKLPYEKAKDVVRAAGVYLATTRETFGIGTIEAMASGVPIVGWNYGGQAEYVTHGVDGWLVEPGDLRGLRDGVVWALANRETVGAAAAERARAFSWVAAAEQYQRVFTEVVERYRTPRPRVSVIVTAHDLEAYLPDALNSVKAQSSKDWECIIVDDASPDRCGDIADEYAAKDSRFKVIHNPENLYLAEARNVAIDMATGHYILPLDADDKLGKTAVEVLADALDFDKTLDIAYGNVLFTDEDGKTPTDYRVTSQKPGHSGWPMPYDASKQSKGFNLLPYASMYRRDMWQHLGGYRRRLRMAEDADLWTRAASFGYIGKYVTDADTLIYRNRPSSMSRLGADRRMDYIRWFPWAKDATLGPAALAGDHVVSLLTPHVSVVIPCGPGHASLVQTAVDSVMAQSYRGWECIVVNDSGEPLTRLPSWVRVIECDRRNVGAARNLGIAAAKGRFFLPLDADDYLQPDALQWLLTAYEEVGEELAIVYCDFWEDPHATGKLTPYRLPDWSCTEVVRRMLSSVVALTPVAVWSAVGGYSEDGIAWEDWDFQLRCAAAGFCSHHLAAPLFTYRKDTGTRRNYSAEDLEQRKDEMRARWGDYLDGGKQMACGCNSKTSTPQVTMVGSAAQPSQDAVLMQYDGDRIGRITYRGRSGAIYNFQRGEPPRWVSGPDAQYFASIDGFRVVAAVQESDPVVAVHA